MALAHGVTDMKPTDIKEEFDPVEVGSPDFVTVLKLVLDAIRGFFRERPAQILGSAILLVMVWGQHGKLELLHKIWPDYRGPGIDLGQRPVLIPGIPWDNELISFWGGAFLLVVVPVLLIKLRFHQPLSAYGLGLPPADRRVLALWVFLTLTLLGLLPFYIGAHDPAMQAIYPFYHPFPNWFAFVLYELTYFPFFLAIEFIFRGYLLFGLAGVGAEEVPGTSGSMFRMFYLGRYALLIQMLPYTAWHLGKPTEELWGTIVWGLAAGATAYAVRSVWPVVLSHWLLNVFLDWVSCRSQSGCWH